MEAQINEFGEIPVFRVPHLRRRRARLRTLSVRYVEGPGSSETMIRLVAGAELGDSSSRT